MLRTRIIRVLISFREFIIDFELNERVVFFQLIFIPASLSLRGQLRGAASLPYLWNIHDA